MIHQTRFAHTVTGCAVFGRAVFVEVFRNGGYNRPWRKPYGGSSMPRLFPIFSAVFFMAVAGAAGLASAQEGTLVVHGTEGATVRIDGKIAGTIPLSPLNLAKGKHSITLSRAGFRSAGERVYLRSIHGATVVLYLEPKTRKGAALRNLAFPGWGSLYNGKRREALGYLALQTALAAYAIDQNRRFGDNRNVYDEAESRYAAAVGAAEIEETRAERDAAYDDLSSSETKRNGAIYAAAIIQLLSAVDGWYRFPFAGNDGARIVLAPSIGGGDTSPAALAIRFRF